MAEPPSCGPIGSGLRAGCLAGYQAVRSAVTQDRIGSVIEAGALRALALAASVEESGVVAAPADALTLACPQGYVRIFVDEGKPMATLLGRLIMTQRAGQAAA